MSVWIRARRDCRVPMLIDCLVFDGEDCDGIVVWGSVDVMMTGNEWEVEAAETGGRQTL